MIFADSQRKSPQTLRWRDKFAGSDEKTLYEPNSDNPEHGVPGNLNLPPKLSPPRFPMYIRRTMSGAP